mmetsp:Transcript_22107/g.36621  ORF Transcript_22107/g.36621 Transcript_22107/m.36621 type:complete len:103 (-) Transcript_22107:53-361(-)
MTLSENCMSQNKQQLQLATTNSYNKCPANITKTLSFFHVLLYGVCFHTVNIVRAVTSILQEATPRENKCHEEQEEREYFGPYVNISIYYPLFSHTVDSNLAK